jgi:hypothetical protein
MNRDAQLLELYHQWRALTQAETLAIQEGNWGKLLETQEQKKSLQNRIDTVEMEAKRETEFQDKAGTGLKETLHELILLEQQNAAALADRQQELEFEQQQMDRSRGNLRQLQKAYSGSVGAVWQSYS